MVVKLSVTRPEGEFKLKVMKEIAKEFQVDWDTKETELELLKPQEETIVCVFFSLFFFSIISDMVWFVLVIPRFFLNNLFGIIYYAFIKNTVVWWKVP